MFCKSWIRPTRCLVVPAVAWCLSGPPALAASSSASASSPAKSLVESWVRPPGDASALEAPGLPRSTIDLDSLPMTEVARFDPQYGKKLLFQGVPLSALLEKLQPPLSVDLALLHFGNGMVVPLPFRDKAVNERLQPFIARKLRASKDAPATSDFPPLVQRAGREFVDVPATRFAGNKVVVKELWHPAVSERAGADFSPWAHTDTLVAIEFVQAAPYYKQFDVTSAPAASAGLGLFLQSCQFCHGARKVGAKFGWDFVEPAPIFTYRKGERKLYYHVHFRRFDAPERGQKMPALKFMTEADAGQLWQWLEAIGTKPMPSYAPKR